MMANQLIPFDFEEQSVRAYCDESGNSWFVARDVALALGYANPQKAVQDHCKSVKLLKSNDSLLLGVPPRGFLVVPESDVWRLILRSQLPKAEVLEKWLMEEVLPTLRKTGTYTMPGADRTAVPPRKPLDMILKELQGEISGIPRRQVEKGVDYALQMARVVGVIDPDELAGAIVESCRLMSGRSTATDFVGDRESGLVREFVETACERAPGYECGSRKLWLAFCAWCEKTHGLPMESCPSNKAISAVLVALGIRRKRVRPTTIFSGILPAEVWRQATA